MDPLYGQSQNHNPYQKEDFSTQEDPLRETLRLMNLWAERTSGDNDITVTLNPNTDNERKFSVEKKDNKLSLSELTLSNEKKVLIAGNKIIGDVALDILLPALKESIEPEGKKVQTTNPVLLESQQIDKGARLKNMVLNWKTDKPVGSKEMFKIGKETYSITKKEKTIEVMREGRSGGLTKAFRKPDLSIDVNRFAPNAAQIKILEEMEKISNTIRDQASELFADIDDISDAPSQMTIKNVAYLISKEEGKMIIREKESKKIRMLFDPKQAQSMVSFKGSNIDFLQALKKVAAANALFDETAKESLEESLHFWFDEHPFAEESNFTFNNQSFKINKSKNVITITNSSNNILLSIPRQGYKKSFDENHQALMLHLQDLLKVSEESNDWNNIHDLLVNIEQDPDIDIIMEPIKFQFEGKDFSLTSDNKKNFHLTTDTGNEVIDLKSWPLEYSEELLKKLYPLIQFNKTNELRDFFSTLKITDGQKIGFNNSIYTLNTKSSVIEITSNNKKFPSFNTEFDENKPQLFNDEQIQLLNHIRSLYNETRAINLKFHRMDLKKPLEFIYEGKNYNLKETETEIVISDSKDKEVLKIQNELSLNLYPQAQMNLLRALDKTFPGEYPKSS